MKMVELDIAVGDIGASMIGRGSFVLGLSPEEYDHLQVIKIPDRTGNFWVAYQKMRFTVSTEIAEKLIELGATEQKNLPW